MAAQIVQPDVARVENGVLSVESHHSINVSLINAPGVAMGQFDDLLVVTFLGNSHYLGSHFSKLKWF
jgi:hypothetical protein